VRTSVRLLLIALVVTSTIGCDRVTKHLATALLADKPARSLLADSVRLEYATNAGGFLSLGADLSPRARASLFTVATGVFIVALSISLVRSRWSFWRSLGIALFLAGGISNWIDRARSGVVVDFLNIGVGWLRTGIFNVADVAIMLGVAIFVASELLARYTREHAPNG
jgi:signal peptidase II